MAEHIIEIKVEEKIASVVGDPMYVCGNSDYVVAFDFDAEWADFETKTARFVKNNKEYIDVVFTGDRCQMPIIENTASVKIGVYAGHLSTTTSATINAQRSILCGSGMPADPEPDVYSQIVEMIDSGMLKGDTGPQGPQGIQGPPGPADSYSAAVDAGYTGTQTQWVSDIASSGVNAEEARTKAQEARNAVENVAPPIICEETGVTIAESDSADRPLRGLTVYGRTTQDGTPTGDAPVELTGAGNASPLRIVTAGKNLAALTPRTESNLGITSSYDAQTGVVTVTGTATGNAFVSYWMREYIPEGLPLVIGLGNGTRDSNISIRAQCISGNTITTIATLDSANKVVKATLKHAFEFLTIRVNAGATVNMKLRIGVTVGSSVTGYAWTHPDDPTGAQIAMPVWHTAVGGLMQGVPALGSDATYVDADGQGWIADTVEYDAQTGTAQIVKRVASVTYDGDASESWVKGGSNSYFAIKRTDKSRASHGLCTHYQGIAINAGESRVGFTAETDKEYIRFRPTGYADMTVDAWRERLAESPVTVLYALAVPETTPITGDELTALIALHSRYPETTVYNDAGVQMAVRYVADTKNYIDQKIEQLTNALVSTGANI